MFHSLLVALYRVEQQTLPVEFFLNFYRMLQDMNLKFDTDNPLGLSYDMIKLLSLNKITVFSINAEKLSYLLCA